MYGSRSTIVMLKVELGSVMSPSLTLYDSWYPVMLPFGSLGMNHRNVTSREPTCMASNFDTREGSGRKQPAICQHFTREHVQVPTTKTLYGKQSAPPVMIKDMGKVLLLQEHISIHSTHCRFPCSSPTVLLTNTTYRARTYVPSYFDILKAMAYPSV